jgi:hypothetical protein
MKKAAARLSGDIDARVYPQSWHLILADLERAAPVSDIAEWIAARADRKPPPLAYGQEQAVSNRP